MLVRAPPFVGACRACAWPPALVGPAVSACSGFGSWCCSRLDGRLVLLVCCRLRRRTAGVVGCCRSVVFIWPGRTGRPPERVWCATPLSWPGRTGRPPERVRCATPCFCFAGVVALLLVVLCSLVFVRFLALRRCLSPPAAVPPHPHPTPPFRLLSPAPPFASWCPAPAGSCPPPPPGVCPSRLVVSSSAFTLVASVPCGWPFVGVSFCPPPPPRVVFPGCWPLPLVFPCPPGSALFFPCLWPWHLFGLVSFSPLGSRWCRPPPPPGGCSWWSAVPRILFCGAAAGCGLLCAARGVLLRRAVLLCGCLAVWCARLLCRWPSPVGVGHALSVGVARCSAWPCCFVRCFVVCGAVVRCRVLWCFPCCSVVSWLFSLCPPGFAHLRVCAAWCCPPPPPWYVCRAFCRSVLPRCAALFCPLWCRVAACCVVLFGVRRAVSCCAVSCCAPRVAWCCAASPRAAASCCVLCRARWCCAVLSCVAPFAGVLRPGALCCAVPLCAVVGCFVPSGVRWRCAVGCVLCCAVVCCCVLCCAFGRGVWLRCAVLSSLWLAVSFWVRCPVLCCASWCCVGPCRVVLCCVVLCCVVVRCAVRWGAASWCSVLCCPTVCCRGLLCAVWCPLALCGWLRAVLRCCLLPCAVLRLWAWCLVAVLSSLWLAVSFWSRCPVLCCAVPPGAVLGRVASCCAVWCCAAVHRAVGVALCCVVSRSVVPLPAVACPRVLCGASGVVCIAACCAVLLCFVLCLGVWCLGALCCAVRVVSCFLVGVCVPVWCAVSLGAVVLCVASCCFVRCSAVAHCAVCVVLCCFCSRFLVLVRAVPCPRALYCAVGCCAVLCGALLCCPVLCALRCVCFGVVLWCVLFLPLSFVLLAPCGVTPVHFQNQKKLFPIFKNRNNCFPLVCLVYPVLPACNNTTH